MQNFDGKLRRLRLGPSSRARSPRRGPLWIYRSSDPPSGVHRAFVILALFLTVGSLAQGSALLLGAPAYLGLRLPEGQPGSLPVLLFIGVVAGEVMLIPLLVLMRAGHHWARVVATGIAVGSMFLLAEDLVRRMAERIGGEGRGVDGGGFDTMIVMSPAGLVLLAVAVHGMYDRTEGYYRPA